MWQLEKGRLFLPKTSLREMKRLYEKEKAGKTKLRLLAAIHRKRGKSLDEITELLEKSRYTIHTWLINFQKRGITAKDSIRQPGRKPKLTIRQTQELVKALERGPPHNPNGLWTTKEVREFIKKKYNISFVSQHIWRILIALGLSLQYPRKKHYKSASIDEIEAFKKKQDSKHTVIERKVLLWAHKMKQPLD